MKRHNNLTIAVAAVTTIVVSSTLLPSCSGRKMSDMEPAGDTVEVVIGPKDNQENTDTVTLPD